MWINKPKDISEYKGFVYQITNLVTGKKYIGKKFFWFTKTLKPLKGQKRKRHIKYESDWKNYYGSCNGLSKDIDRLGKRKFKREILVLCENKWECTYHEARIQFEKGVLLSDDWYNGWIRLRLAKKK